MLLALTSLFNDKDEKRINCLSGVHSSILHQILHIRSIVSELMAQITVLRLYVHFSGLIKSSLSEIMNATTGM